MHNFENDTQNQRTITPTSVATRRPMSSIIPGRQPNTYNDPIRYTQVSTLHILAIYIRTCDKYVYCDKLCK